MTGADASRPLAVSVGEPSGVGPDVALLAFARRATETLPPFVLIADPDMMAARAARLGLAIRIAVVGSPDGALPTDALPVLPLSNRHVETPGRIDPANVAGTIEAIARATGMALDGAVSGVVTNPISKKALYDAGFRHPGHTEYLGALCSRRLGRDVTPVMLLAGPSLACVPVTIHIPLRDVAGTLTRALIIETGRIVARDYRDRLGVARPRLAVSGLNPHAGERGAMGQEDEDIIRPAVAQLVAEGIDARGPLPGDTMFHAEARRTYDVALCMYHDQALIPAKTLAFDETVNVTLGLPIIRTSPDHGTAFDIAARGGARPDSLIAALRLAARLAAVPAAG